MEIISRTSNKVTTDTHEIATQYGHVIYIEYIDGKNKVIDFVLRSKNSGEDIDDPALLEEIQDLVDGMPPTK